MSSSSVEIHSEVVHGEEGMQTIPLVKKSLLVSTQTEAEKETHASWHTRIGEQIDLLVAQHRDRIGILSSWTIEHRILCPAHLPDAESSLWWDTALSYALLLMRCELPMSLYVWLVVHELYELLLYELGDCYIDLYEAHAPTPLSRYLYQRHHDARNRCIESLVAKHLGYRRPAHVIDSSLVRTLGLDAPLVGREVQ